MTDIGIDAKIGVVVGYCHDPDGSEEFQSGRAQLLRSLPRQAIVHETRARHWDELWSTAKGLGFPEGTHVLLLRHPHLILAPGTVQSLSAGLTCSPDGAYGLAMVVRDGRYAPDQHAPDYCTMRGMERYVTALPDTLHPQPVLQESLACAVTATTLRGAQWSDVDAKWANKSWAHDFSGYHSGSRDEVIPLVPSDTRRILDVGGGEGHFLRALKKAMGCETHLAEYSHAACKAAAAHVDRVWPGDFLKSPIDTQFDCISFLDVLEHTESPLPWLARARTLLAPGGCVVASIPNVGHWSVIADLLEGRWDYVPVGIHCVTHLRYYTRSSIENLFAESGFTVADVQATLVPMPTWLSPLLATPGLAIDREGLNAYNWLIRAEPC